MVRFRKNADVLIAYLKQDTPEGSNPRDSLSFKGVNLYSYNSLLTILDLPNKTLLIDHDIRCYSNTTSKQTHVLVKQASDFTIYSIPLGLKPHKTLQFYWRRIEESIGKYKRARANKVLHASFIKNLITEAEQYSNYAGVDKLNKEYKQKHQITKELFKHKIL